MSFDITPDFSEAVEIDNSPVPPGFYNVRIDGGEAKKSKAGNDYIQWKMKIFGAEGDLSKYNNRFLSMSTPVSGKGAGILKQFLLAACNGEMPSFGPGWMNQLSGKELQVQAEKNIKPDGTEGWPNVKNPKPYAPF